MITQAIALLSSAVKTSRQRLLPFTYEKRIELAAELRIPATYEEYIEYVCDCDYRLQYHDGHIISFIEHDEKTNAIMGEAAPIHERLVMRMALLIGQLLDMRIEGRRYELFGSNIKIYIPNYNKSYNPDMAVALEPAEYIKHKPKKRTVTSLVNPHIIVEVMSNGTRQFDKYEKLPNYKAIDSVQQIIFIEPSEVSISTFIRVSANEWRNLDYKSMDDHLPIVGENAIPLKDIYGYLILFGKG
jgi:Uma2 family endonuclease